MDRLDKKIKELSALSKDKRIDLGKKVFDSLKKKFVFLYEDEEMSKLILIGFPLQIILSDNVLKDEELSFFNTLMGTNYNHETIREIDKYMNGISLFINYFKLLDKKIRKLLITLCILFAICDDDMHEDELKLIKTLI